jgi:hypothetical protein
LKRKYLLSFAILFGFLFAVPISASAVPYGVMGLDSVSVYFQNMKQKNVYVTLLAEETSTGRWKTENPDHQESNEYVWHKFHDYHDPDGYHFLQYYHKLGENSTFTWNGYTPKKFKILLYFRDYDTFAVSRETYLKQPGATAKLAVDASVFGNGPVVNGTTFTAEEDYDFKSNAVSLCVIILAAIAIKLLIALPFGYRKMPQFIFIAAVNVLTQIVLYVLMLRTDFLDGSIRMVASSLILVLLLFEIEAVIYSRVPIFTKYAKPERKLHPVLYSLTANAASYLAGLGLFFAFPQFF